MIDKLKIRCSALGKIMPSSRSGGKLSETAKTYIQELFLENTYGVKNEFWSRYTEKGKEVEKESISLASEVLGLDIPFLEIENEVQDSFENDYIKGSVDMFYNNHLLEIKSSFDGTTFPWFAEENPNKSYFYQVQGYLWLTGAEYCTLAYCLVNTPEEIVQDEIRREYWKLKLISEDEEVEKYIRTKHNFDHIPKEKRVKSFIIEKNEGVWNQIKEKVELCREYYNTLK
jgi:hypothetical protein